MLRYSVQVPYSKRDEQDEINTAPLYTTRCFMMDDFNFPFSFSEFGSLEFKGLQVVRVFEKKKKCLQDISTLISGPGHVDDYLFTTK